MIPAAFSAPSPTIAILDMMINFRRKELLNKVYQIELSYKNKQELINTIESSYIWFTKTEEKTVTGLKVLNESYDILEKIIDSKKLK